MMKKIILATMMAGLVPMVASAQGTVSLSSSTANHKVLWLEPGISAGLYWGPLGSQESALIQLGASTGVNSLNGFLINGGVRTTGLATSGGASATFQIRAWNGGWADSDSALLNGATVHKSVLFTNPTGDPLGTPPGPAAQLSGWTMPFPIPEPSMTAIAGLGAVASLLFRRRK